MSKNQTHSYRVVWQRKDCRKQFRSFETFAAAERWATLLGPEPWKAFGKDPDDMVRYEDCTVREKFMARRKEMPPLVFVRIDRRPVGAWEEVAK